MRKILLYLLLTLALFSSCCKDDVPEVSYSHTVVLYFPWSGSETSAAGGLFTEFKQNIKSIKNAIIKERGTGTTRVMIILATSATEGQLSEVVYSDGACSENLLRSYTDWSFTTKDNIKTMFDDVASFAGTPTYSMLIGSHGMGWLPRQSRPERARAFGGTTPGMKTEIDVLDSAIVESGIRHLNFLCFDDCYMANVETAYQLRNATDCLIASTSEIMAIGLPYEDIWTDMKSADANYSSIVAKFHSFYSSYTSPYGALSVIDCRKVELAASVMRQLNTRLAASGIVSADIQEQALDGFNSHVFYDMKAYTDKAVELLGGDTSLQSQLDAVYADMVVAHSSTAYLYSVYLVGNIFKVTSNCGVTISDPSANSEASSYVKGTLWWKATH